MNEVKTYLTIKVFHEKYCKRCKMLEKCVALYNNGETMLRSQTRANFSLNRPIKDIECMYKNCFNSFNGGSK